DDALGDRRLGDEEGPRDLVGRQAAEQAEGEGDAGLGGEYRVARREDESQEVVADVVVEGRVEIRRYPLLGLPLATDFLVLALDQLLSAKEINCPMLGGGQEPGARIVRDARLGPLLEGGDQGILREVFGQAYVAHDPRQAGDESRCLDPPDRIDRAMGVGSR